MTQGHIYIYIYYTLRHSPTPFISSSRRKEVRFKLFSFGFVVFLTECYLDLIFICFGINSFTILQASIDYLQYLSIDTKIHHTMMMNDSSVMKSTVYRIREMLIISVVVVVVMIIINGYIITNCLSLSESLPPPPSSTPALSTSRFFKISKKQKKHHDNRKR